MSPRSPTLANMATCSDSESDGISEEIELLQAIYVQELAIHGPMERPSMVDLYLHPSTGDNDHDSKYVCLNLLLTIPKKYPFSFPGITIKNPRGLSDAHLTSIQENLIALAKEKIGSPMLYDLIEYAKECLSDNNIPSCPCVICLEHFERDEKFVKTECYHYFHTACLSNYVDHFLSESDDKTIVCPMCRLEIVYNKSECDSEDNTSSAEETFVYKPDEEQLKAQAERMRVFEYQKQKGGIINIEEERNKYLIGIKDKKEEENESKGLSSDRIPEQGGKETSGSIGLPPSSVSSLSEDQSSKGDEKYDERQKAPSKVAKGQKSRNRTQENFRDKNEDGKMDNDGRKGIQVTERVDSGVNKEKASIPDSKERVSRQGKERKDPNEFKKNEERRRRKPQMSTGHRNESKSQFKTSRRIPGEGGKFKDEEGSQRIERDLRSKNEDSERYTGLSEGGIKRQLGGEKSRNEVTEKNEKITGKTDGNFEKNCSEKKGELPSKEPVQGEGKTHDICRKDKANSREDGRKYQATEGKSSPSRTLTERREVKRESGRNISNSGSSKQIGNKQSSRDTHRNTRSARTPTPQRPQKNDKAQNPQRSYSSVTSETAQSASTKRGDQTATKRDSPVLENDNESKNKSTKTLPGKTNKTFSNVVGSCVDSSEEVMRGSKPPTRRPPPGFESYRPSDSEALEQRQKVLSAESVRTTSDSSVKRGKPPRRAPPGFEKVKEN